MHLEYMDIDKNGFHLKIDDTADWAHGETADEY